MNDVQNVKHVESTEDAMKIISNFAQECYNQGCKDTMKGFLLGAAIATGMVLVGMYREIKVTKTKTEQEQQQS